MQHGPEPLEVADQQGLIEAEFDLHLLDDLRRDLRIHLEGGKKVAGRKRHDQERQQCDPHQQWDHVDQSAYEESSHPEWRLSYWALELDPLWSIELAPHGGIVVLHRTLPCRVLGHAYGLYDRELVMKDFLYPPVVGGTFARFHHRGALQHHLVDFRFPGGRRLGLIGIPDVKIA